MGLEQESSVMSADSIVEFKGHFNKVDLENRFLAMEGALNRQSDDKAEIVQSIFREIHSLKGTAGMLKLDPVATFLHSFEDALGVLSRNIRRIVGIIRNDVFDFFLQGLDLVERLLAEYESSPRCVLKDQKRLFSFYVRMLVDARQIVQRSEDYFEFEALDESAF